MSKDKIKILISFPFLVNVQSAYSLDYDRIYKGRYTWGEGVDVFTPCGEKNTFWTSYNWGGFTLREFHVEHIKEPYAPIYIEFRGHMLDEAVDGFAEGYDGLIHISEVKEMSVEIPKECK